ncbi:phage integrase central domain-containing protein [Aurantiacibacter xanthus]|uniref:phage integrase central domain-containing protein n=1 Tax=Aurantiacibacter xanthus TaxID=1784712 RepID=UPI001FE720F6|nr:hypothetical protein [Aurantiacibacter xanthus]
MGLDPVFERRKAAGIPTFREAAAKVLAQHRKTWRNAKHEHQWLRTLETYVFPHIGNQQVNDITGPMMRNVLAQIWLSKPESCCSTSTAPQAPIRAAVRAPTSLSRSVTGK